MLDLKHVLGDLETVRQCLDRRGGSVPEGAFDEMARLDKERRAGIAEAERLKKERNETSPKIGQLIKKGEDASGPRERVREIGERIKELDEEVKRLESSLEGLMLALPNLPHESCPVGEDESANRTERTWGEAPDFSFEPRDHVEIGEIAGVLDFERAAKVTGARFVFLSGAGARLSRALVQFMMDLHADEHGYTELLPPFLVNRGALVGTGQLPKYEDDLFRLADPDDWYLVPTAEVPVTNLHAGEILAETSLPRRYVAYTPCFRSEAGSYGKDVRGIIRQHQFEKVELVQLVHPDRSYEALDELTAHAEEVLRRLGLHYRVVTLSTGDLGFAAAKTFDLEVWLPSQGRFREISSCSNYEDFQARRTGTRFRPDKEGKPRFVHTLNGSALAIGRTIVAIMEQFQREDGSFDIPDALRPYMAPRVTPRAT